jgi:hypothetical protein
MVRRCPARRTASIRGRAHLLSQSRRARDAFCASRRGGRTRAPFDMTVLSLARNPDALFLRCRHPVRGTGAFDGRTTTVIQDSARIAERIGRASGVAAVRGVVLSCSREGGENHKTPRPRVKTCAVVSPSLAETVQPGTRPRPNGSSNRLRKPHAVSRRSGLRREAHVTPAYQSPKVNPKIPSAGISTVR